ncbi:DUF2513 domain-containing protein [Paenibacillus massiliensis]|uniref:DUF2513 domain-containing protein n=1 Tax=Paenibacillus massiliensis TaxID=225917 RepID=UPI0012EB3D40|nr:DUF2513 domain-containing protein [Paenibacillus massiliensis]
MRLDHDCVRDILLTIEKYSTLNNVLTSFHFQGFDETKSYPLEDIIYTIARLNEAGFLNGSFRAYDNWPLPLISGLTYKGHEFLDNIRDNNVWEKTKEKVGSSFASVSISVIGQVAGSIAKGMMGFP